MRKKKRIVQKTALFLSALLALNLQLHFLAYASELSDIPEMTEASEENAGEIAGEAAGENSAGEAAGETTGGNAGAAAGENKGETAGEAAGEAAGETTGENAGAAAGENTGETAGETTGENAGEAAGETAGEAAGETTGENAGEAAGETAGETTEEAGMEGTEGTEPGEIEPGETAGTDVVISTGEAIEGDPSLSEEEDVPEEEDMPEEETSVFLTPNHTLINWSQVPQQSGYGNIYSWAAVQDTEYLYFYIRGAEWLNGHQYDLTCSLSVQYDFGTQENNQDYLQYNWNGHNGVTLVYTFSEDQENWLVRNAYNSEDIEGAFVSAVFSDGERQIVFGVPQSYFPNVEFTIEYCNTSLHSSQITFPDGSDYPARDDGFPDGEGTDEDEMEDGEIEPADPDAVYTGISIDGEFDDWAAVAKTKITDKDEHGQPKGENAADYVAMIWDGDFVYLYFRASGKAGAGNWNSVTWMGPMNNGQLVIVSDLGYTLPFQLIAKGKNASVSGVNGAQAAVNNTEWFGAPHMWEISIPASELPKYSKTISLGFYQGEIMISDVENRQAGDEEHSFSGIEYDGKYEDWAYYPHTTIGYVNNSGRQGEGALYADGDLLYGHMKVTGLKFQPEIEYQDGIWYPWWLQMCQEFYEQWLKGEPVWEDYEQWMREQPWWDRWQNWVKNHIWWEEWQTEWHKNPDWYQYQDLFSWMSLCINQSGTGEKGSASADMGLTIIPKDVWDAEMEGYKNDSMRCRPPEYGEQTAYTPREFYILNAAREGAPVVIGRMYITAGSSGCEAEWQIEIPKIAEHYGVDASDLKIFGMQFIRIGNEWIWVAGTDTAPWLGVILCIGMAAAGSGFYVYRRRRKAGVR